MKVNGFAFKETLNNIRKHACATGVAIAIDISSTSLKFTVQDNGKGFDSTAPAHARWHAIWTLDAIDAGAASRDAIIALAALQDGWLPPQAAGAEMIMDPALAGLTIPTRPGLPLGGDMVLSNSLGFWGYHAALVFGRA
jgi:hypothetical protein